MHIYNITDIRQNASKIITEVVREKVPAIILQRSKPVAYIIEADEYENMQKRLERAVNLEKADKNKAAMQKITEIRNEMMKNGKQPDSVAIIRQLREDTRNE